MNEYLAQHYRDSLAKLDTGSLKVPQDEKSVIAYLNGFVSDWTFEITDVQQLIDDTLCVSVVLYLPKLILSGMGSSYHQAICNILRDITYDCQSVQQDNNKQDLQKSKVTGVLKELRAKKNASSNNPMPEPTPPVQEQQAVQTNPSGAEDLFGNTLEDMMNSNSSPFTPNAQPTQPEQPVQQQTSSEPTTVPFFSEKAEEIGKQVAKELEEEAKPKFIPSPEIINPTNQIYGPSCWTQEQQEKGKAFMKIIGANSEDEFSSWTKRYCQLDFMHFNPAYMDQLIEWVQEMRQHQTY